MATGIRRIEKEFLLKTLMDEMIPLKLKAAHSEWDLMLESIDAKSMVLKSELPIKGLRKNLKVAVYFTFRGQPISFNAVIREVKDQKISFDPPESLYKNLSRKYSRVSSPYDLEITFTFGGERFVLDFPKSEEFNPVDTPEMIERFNPSDIRELMKQLAERVSGAASEHSVIMFREKKPTNFEEQCISTTGKIYYLPTTASSFPEIDPFVTSRILTKSMVERRMEISGKKDRMAEDLVDEFVAKKRDDGVLSEMLVPIIFQEYVVGYIHLSNKEAGIPPFDLNFLEHMSEFAQIIAYSLKLNSYFMGAERRDSEYQAQVIDISASGILFANTSRSLSSSMPVKSFIILNIKTGKRTISVEAEIKRKYSDSLMVYYGAEYRDLKPEDLRFLFEYIYGRAFTDADAKNFEFADKSDVKG